jgi:2-hydroxy-3-oxopropionate reductase
MEKLKVGFIGLGKMGEGMVKNLLKAGFFTTVYDIRKEPLEKMERLGANVSGSPKEVALNSDVVISMVRDNSQTEQVLFGEKGVLKGMKRGCIIIMSTISPDFANRYGPKLEKEVGVHLLDAPVSGGPMAADAGTLSIMVGGEESVFKQYLPIFRTMGKNIFYCGPSEAGCVAKLTNNLIYAATMAALSEAVALGLKEGLDVSTLLGIYKVS